MKLHEHTATELLQKLATGETTPVEMMAHYLERIEKLEPKIHALTFVNKDNAMKEVEKAEKELKKPKAKKRRANMKK